MAETIFLIGFMGVGKTSIGKKLANKLNVPFIDTDDLIEKEVGMSIADYFAENGERSFREIEKTLIKNTDFKNSIVATGGGLPCFHDNMKTMNEKGVTIFLSRPAKELQQRLVNAKKQRPLINQLNDNQLTEFITSKLDERLPFYEKAKLTLDRNSQTVDEIIKRISQLD